MFLPTQHTHPLYPTLALHDLDIPSGTLTSPSQPRPSQNFSQVSRLSLAPRSIRLEDRAKSHLELPGSPGKRQRFLSEGALASNVLSSPLFLEGKAKKSGGVSEEGGRWSEPARPASL